MNCTSDNFSIPVPNVFEKAIRGLLLPGERLEDILDEVGDYRSTDLELKESIWNSKTMTLDKKKLKTLDMFFSKIKEEEHDSSEDDSTDSDKSELTKGFSPLATKKKNKKKASTNEITKVNEINYAGKNKGSRHSVSSSEEDSPGHSITNSQIYSQDMFAEETISSKKEYHSSAEKSVSPNPVEHSGSDDEIIPSSQAPSDSNRLSLGSLSSSIRSEITQKSNLVSNKSEEVYKLPKEPVRKKSFLSSSKRRSLSPRNDSSLSEEHNKRPSFSERKSMNNSMKSVNEFFSEINPDIDTLSHSDLTEDDEVYVIQCPSEIDLKQLKGLNLSLHGDCIISIGSEENNKYDCFLVKETSKRNLYVALPDGDKEEMKIGMIPLAGNIILSENLNIPYNKPIKGENEFGVPDETNNDISKNKKKKDRSYEDSTQDEQELSISDISINDVSKKKKKKHCTYEDYSTQDEHELSVSDVTINDISKKKHRSYEDSTQDEHELSVYDMPINDISKKKKKKHSTYEDSTQDEQEFSASELKVNDASKKKKKKHKSYEDLTHYESDMSVSHVTIKDVSKKKKKKHKTNEDEIQDGTEVSECFSKSATEDVLNNLISKKKKRKNKTLGNDEINSSTTDLDKFLNIKTEWVEPQVDSGHQETNKRKRKRDMEDSVVDTEGDIIIKKEKKKHCHSGSQYTLSLNSQED